MDSIKYSVVIRTVGNAGEKYKRTLESIDRQTIKPLEVIVVLPKGYSLPKERLGYEQFYFSDKGMVIQRIYGGNIAKGDYILFLDDDVEFEEDFVKKMCVPMVDKMCSVTIPPILDMLPPKKGYRKYIPLISAAAVPTIFHKNMYTKILKSGGWSYNHFDEKKVSKYLLADTAAGPCCFCEKKAFIDIKYEQDLWLQDTDYALWDDQVMFYKFRLYNYRIICVTDAKFKHLDAGSSSKDRKIKAAYANTRNKYIFWYKYIYKYQNNIISKLLSVIAYNYSCKIGLFIYRVASIIKKEKKAEYFANKKGYMDAKEYIKQINSSN